MLKRFKNTYKYVKYEQYLPNKIEALDKNLNVIYVGTGKKIAELTKTSKSLVLRMSKRHKQHLVNGFVFRNDNVRKIKIIERTNDSIKVTATSKDKVMEFNSIKEAARWFKCDDKNISRRLKGLDKPLNGYIVKYGEV